MHFQFRLTGVTIEVVMALAITNSLRVVCMFGSTLRAAFGCVTVLAGLVFQLHAAADFPAAAEQEYHAALENWRKDSSSLTAAVAVARAAFMNAELVTRDSARAELAERGMEAARFVIARDAHHAAAHYWLAMNQGQLARTKLLGALGLVKDMVREFLQARDLDEHVDFAGPDRSLGLLYRDAPGWPTSVGDKSRARSHLLRAVKLHPEFPENQLCLLESYEKWGERERFDQQLKTAERVVQEAREKFTGPDWEYSRSDWENRLAAMKSKASGVGRVTHPKGAK